MYQSLRFGVIGGAGSMSQTIDEHIQTGCAHAFNVLRIIAAEHGEDAARAMAGGLVTGARNYLVANHGARCAFDLLAGLSDSTLDPVLAAANIEAEIGEMVRERRKK